MVNPRLGRAPETVAICHPVPARSASVSSSLLYLVQISLNASKPIGFTHWSKLIRKLLSSHINCPAYALSPPGAALYFTYDLRFFKVTLGNGCSPGIKLVKTTLDTQLQAWVATGGARRFAQASRAIIRNQRDSVDFLLAPVCLDRFIGFITVKTAGRFGENFTLRVRFVALLSAKNAQTVLNQCRCFYLLHLIDSC